jgi:hypothetical protein
MGGARDGSNGATFGGEKRRVDELIVRALPISLRK